VITCVKATVQFGSAKKKQTSKQARNQARGTDLFNLKDAWQLHHLIEVMANLLTLHSVVET